MSGVVEIPLTRGLVALIDEVDLPLVAPFKWHAGRRHQTPEKYVAVSGRGGANPTLHGRVYMHRLILGASHGQLVDHKNGDPLDNRRANLRIATRAQNNTNKSLTRIPNSGFRGVCKQSGCNLWDVRFRFDGKLRYTGSYASPEEAARAYDEAARLHHGEFAVLNFPGPGERGALTILSGQAA